MREKRRVVELQLDSGIRQYASTVGDAGTTGEANIKYRSPTPNFRQESCRQHPGRWLDSLENVSYADEFEYDQHEKHSTDDAQRIATSNLLIDLALEREQFSMGQTL